MRAERIVDKRGRWAKARLRKVLDHPSTRMHSYGDIESDGTVVTFAVCYRWALGYTKLRVPCTYTKAQMRDVIMVTGKFACL